MASEKQIKANRENAKKSTGPRTNSGKSRTSKNALKHGLLAQDAVLPGEDPAEFDQHLTSFEETYLPRNRVEKEIVRQIADVSWRMQRLSRIETAVIAAGIDNTRRSSSLFNYETGPMPEDRQERTHILGWTMLTRTKLLDSLARYDGRLGRRFFRGVELMIDIRREERQLREAREAENAGATTPIHYLPDDDPPAMQNTAPSHRPDIGFRPAEKSGVQWGMSPDLPSHQPKKLGKKMGTVPSAEEKSPTQLSSIAGAKRTVPQFSPARQSTNRTNQKNAKRTQLSPKSYRTHQVSYAPGRFAICRQAPRGATESRTRTAANRRHPQ